MKPTTPTLVVWDRNQCINYERRSPEDGLFLAVCALWYSDEALLLKTLISLGGYSIFSRFHDVKKAIFDFFLRCCPMTRHFWLSDFLDYSDDSPFSSLWGWNRGLSSFRVRLSRFVLKTLAVGQPKYGFLKSTSRLSSASEGIFESLPYPNLGSEFNHLDESGFIYIYKNHFWSTTLVIDVILQYFPNQSSTVLTRW
jgi:hypothetical protein